MTSADERLLHEITILAGQLPEASIAPLAEVIAQATPGAWAELVSATCAVFAAPRYREAIAAVIAAWEQSAPHMHPHSVAFALRAAAQAGHRQRRMQSLELVWTGPSSGQSLRRTAQVLQDLIDTAQRELLIVSFAVYEIPEIRAALLRAAERGVQISLVIESPRESNGRLAYDNLLAFGSHIRNQASVYHWPAQQRPTDDQGRPGSLHAKCAVADNERLLISSANLTHYALNLNMELGVLITGGSLPAQVTGHLRRLVQQRTLVIVRPPQ